jgi:uncharacterized protein YjbJ (UPF0337 family)
LKEETTSDQGVASMAQGPQDAAESAAEGLKGTLKKTVGAVTGNDRMAAEGDAQQDKAEAKKDAAVKEAEAEKARAEAAAHEGQ